tara:strand:+ start:345 stop:602 length:258 start_codon:yes stop_codon:yes gene_type:complete
MTQIVNKKHSNYDVDIGRPSIWGNPYIIGRDGDRATVVAKYKEHFLGSFHLKQLATEKLKGKVLGCYCKPEACHGDIIVDFLEGQ